MRKFWIRVVTVIAVIALLYGYNQVTAKRVEADAQAKAEADAANAEIAALNAAASSETSGWADGTYQGSAMGFGGDIVVEVTVADGAITDLTIVSADNEDGAYLETATDIIADILDAQSTDVDTISGATFSSTGIRDAAAAALEEAIQ